MENKIFLEDVTFVIPVRIDTLERLENLQATTNYILSHCDTNILIVESDKRDSGFLRKLLHPSIQLFFEKDEMEIFHRTRYINAMVQITDTPYLAVWDADVIVQPIQLDIAAKSLRNAETDIIIPYTGRFFDTGISLRNEYLTAKDISVLEKNNRKMKLPFGVSACGGGFLVNKQIYRAAGMENANFFGWGIEDGERVKRMEILGYKVGRVNYGPMYHLTHPRGINSVFRTEEAQKAAIKEFLRICNMSKEELQEEIATWYHVKNS